MVHVNVAAPDLAIALSKVQITDLAPVAVMREAFGACRGASLVTVDRDLHSSAFNDLSQWIYNLVRVELWLFERRIAGLAQIKPSNSRPVFPAPIDQLVCVI